MTLPELQNKKIGIIGLGTNNQKLAEFLKRHEINYGVIDQWTGHDTLIGRLDEFEIIFRSPGLPYLSPAVQQAKAKGVEISSQTKLFFKLCPCPIIGVTGTKGKGTTSSLIAAILKQAGKTVWLAGNIGRDPFEFLDEIKSEDWVVLELSSFQLQDLDQSPHLAVVLNITPDHLNYHQDLEEYTKAKSAVLEFQKPSDWAVLHPSLPEAFKNLGAGQKIFFDPATAALYQTKLLGRHNWDNLAAAATAAKTLGVAPDLIESAIAKFESLPHRLKLLKTLDDVAFVDDGFSTNIDPVLAAIDAFETPEILIVGGYNKGLDFTDVGRKILAKSNVKGLVVIGQMTEKILQAISGFKGQILTGAQNMPEILAQARSIAASGDTVIFSPGTSSFDMFKNESDRAEQFVQAVEAIQ